MAGERKTGGRRPSAPDRALFRKAMEGVRPLGDRRRTEIEPDDAEPDRAQPDSAGSPARPGPPLPAAPATALPPLSADAPAGVDARTVTRLRRGQIRPEARIDLHGMTLDAAHRAVASFIESAAGRGLRCVIVITGKGKAGEERGTIRAELPRWLDRPSLRPRILAIATAQPRDGGLGARYVLLRRPRKP